jgi:thiamine biosynthesis lipoprotein
MWTRKASPLPAPTSADCTFFNPRAGNQPVSDIVSLTVIGPNIHDADRFATAAFAMGADGIRFIEQLPGYEGYIIDKNQLGTMTSGFEKYTQP